MMCESREVLTQARAREAFEAAKSKAIGFPWIDILRRELTPGEDWYVRDIWASLPGNSAWWDAFAFVLNGRDICPDCFGSIGSANFAQCEACYRHKFSAVPNSEANDG